MANLLRTVVVGGRATPIEIQAAPTARTVVHGGSLDAAAVTRATALLDTLPVTTRQESQPWARLPASSLDAAIRSWRDDGVLTATADGQLVVDAVRLDLTRQAAAVAPTLSPDVAEAIRRGAYRADPPATIDFGLDASRRQGLAASLSQAVRDIGRRWLRDDDAASPNFPPLTRALADFTGVIQSALDPRLAVTRYVNARLEGLGDGAQEHLDDVMAGPDLSEPTYAQLRAISPDWLLAGIDRLPPNTTSLAQENRAFIHAFLAGMNHELSRELLWREYPTDQRGTYARQFWSRPAATSPEGRYDLPRPLHAMDRATLSTLHGASRDPALVLIVRGDVVRRFPGVIVQAAQTRTVGGVRTMDVDRPVHDPDFVGRIEPDILLLGFSRLTESEVRAAAVATPPHDDQAWWFFFSEHFGEPRFGLDEPPDGAVARSLDSWNDLHWGHVPVTAAAPHLTATSLSVTLPKRLGRPQPAHAWGVDGAQQAWICLQFPFRRGVPAITLLPPVKSPT